MRKVNPDSRTPPWQQIADVLRADIAMGLYGPDDRLPSVAGLAAEWGVNRKTANKALQALAAEQLIEVEPGMGYYIKQRLCTSPDDNGTFHCAVPTYIITE